VCQFLQNPEDLRWLRQAHLPLAAPAFRSAILYGNEDAPAKIELYADRMPHYQAKPVATITRRDGDFADLYEMSGLFRA